MHYLDGGCPPICLYVVEDGRMDGAGWAHGLFCGDALANDQYGRHDASTALLEGQKQKAQKVNGGTSCLKEVLEFACQNSPA